MSPFRPIAAAVLLSAAAPVLAQAALATDRYAPTPIVEYWRTHAPGSTIGDDRSENAPGWYPESTSLKLHQPSGGPRIPQAQAELLKRKLDIAFQALMSQPSLKDIRGASLQAGLNVSVVPTEDGTRLVGATLSLNAKSIHIDDPRTYALGGRYQTPWEEGAVLRVYLNPYEFVSSRDVQAEGLSGRTIAVRTGAATGLIVTDAPHQGEWSARDEATRLKNDESWYKPGAPGVHPMLVHMSSYRQENQELRAGKLKPTRPAARLAAAMFMVDWEDVQRRMAAVK